MLPRKPRLLLAGLVTSVMAFALTSAAVGSAEQPQLRANLPVANLPTSALSEREQIMANNLGAGHGARFGIPPTHIARHVSSLRRRWATCMSSPARVALA